MSRAFTSSSASTTARCFLRMSIEMVSTDVLQYGPRHHGRDLFGTSDARADLGPGDRDRRHVHVQYARPRLFSERRGSARTAEHRETAQRKQFTRAVPGAELLVLVRADQHDERNARAEIGAERAERVEGVSARSRRELALIERVARLAGDRECQHRDAV